jgi:hypothetical protein
MTFKAHAERKQMSSHQLFLRLEPGVFLAVSLMFTGCLSDHDGSGSRGVSLSRAMESSASGSRESLHGSGSRESYTSVDTGVGVAVTAGSSGDASGSGFWQDLKLQMEGAGAVPFNGEFQSITRFTLTASAENDRYALGFFLGGDAMGLKPGTLPDNAIENTWMLEAGLSGRMYLNPAHAFISPYLSASIAWQMLFWDYRRPVFVDGEEINFDALEGAGGYAGFGIALNRGKNLSVFGEAGVGGTVFVEQTQEGFDNDVFHNFGYFMVKAGLNWKF